VRASRGGHLARSRRPAGDRARHLAQARRFGGAHGFRTRRRAAHSRAWWHLGSRGLDKGLLLLTVVVGDRLDPGVVRIEAPQLLAVEPPRKVSIRPKSMRPAQARQSRIVTVVACSSYSGSSASSFCELAAAREVDAERHATRLPTRRHESRRDGRHHFEPGRGLLGPPPALGLLESGCRPPSLASTGWANG
jgi:hypothetical protein